MPSTQLDYNVVDVAALEKSSKLTGPISGASQGLDESIHIKDIRQPRHEDSLVEEIHRGLNPPKGKLKSLPTLLLYDELGLKLFEDITYLEEYYLTNAEIDVLESHAADIARVIVPGSMIVELGSG